MRAWRLSFGNLGCGAVIWSVALTAGAATRGGDHESGAMWDEARRFYVHAAAGDAAALREATRLLERLVEEGAVGARAWAYLGSSRLLEAAAAAAPLRKLELSRAGGMWLERAVAVAPEDVEVRVVRGLSLVHLPAFFHKRKLGQADLLWAYARLEQAEDVPAELRAAVCWQVGLLYERQRQVEAARDAWARAVQWAPQSRAGGLAAARLKQDRLEQ